MVILFHNGRVGYGGWGGMDWARGRGRVELSRVLQNEPHHKKTCQVRLKPACSAEETS